eukprot:CAMPEP_0114495092 /NCGR_PEP_ID=MMETSP0109-20121206/5014_1 /TAXON_ID=29199 /ORGANISM="Chlorarachnion reptans, Strain CCCM449" /LENGTH=972 /DNA_ID=CAMNT_0001672199 /DNA_START=429 /DNA_END=3347 /DNA_ORIENTATION=+
MNPNTNADVAPGFKRWTPAAGSKNWNALRGGSYAGFGSQNSQGMALQQQQLDLTSAALSLTSSSSKAEHTQRLVEILNNCMNPNHNIRTQAEGQLAAMVQGANYPAFVSSLIQVMLKEDSPIPIKQQAGIYLKNTISAKDEQRLRMLQDRWIGVPEQTRSEVKQGLLEMLRSEQPRVPQLAAQVIAKLFAAEMSIQGWPDLVSSLTQLVGQARQLQQQQIGDSKTDGPKKDKSTRLGIVALTTLGYVCEEMEEDTALQDDVNQALTAIIASMQGPDPDTIYSAVNALRNAIHLTGRNFEVPSERDMIMKMLCEAATSTEHRVKIIGYESLALIAERFYGKLAPYMEAIYTLTVQSLQRQTSEPEDDEVAVVAIEFWSVLAEVEDDLLYEAQHKTHRPGAITISGATDSSEKCMNYIKAVAPHLAPVLFNCLTRQDEFDDDAWNSAKASAASLELMSRLVGDSMLEYLLPRIQQFLTSNNWREQEAGLMALGSILDGPSNQALEQSITPQLLSLVFNMLSYEHVLVRDSAAWIVSRLAQHFPQSLAGPHEDATMQAIFKCLEDKPRVAVKALGTVYHLARHQIRSKRMNRQSAMGLDKYFGGLVRKLHVVSERADAKDENLATVAYDTIIQLIKAASSDDMAVVEETVRHAIARAQQTTKLPAGVSLDIKDENEILQGQLVRIMEACLAVLNPSATVVYSKEIMSILLFILKSPNTAAHQECIRTAGLVAQEIGTEFSQYMTLLWPFLLQSLHETSSASTYITAVLAVSDVTRALEGNIYNFCDEIVSALLNALSSPTVESRAKPPTLSAIGDIALAISGRFIRYASAVLTVLQQATEFNMPVDEPESRALRNELWEGILTAYSGVLVGMRDASPAAFAETVNIHTGTMAGFVRKISEVFISGGDDARGLEDVVRAACGLLGDIATGCGPEARIQLQQPVIQMLLEVSTATQEFSQSTKDTANYARQAIYSRF